MRGRIKLSVFIAALASMMLPSLVPAYYMFVINVICISVIMATGMNIVLGNAGQISLANAAFAGIGAYTSAIMTTKLGISMWVTIPIGAILATASGFIIGLPALKLSGHYLALATLGFTQIIQLLLIHWESLTNGPVGIVIPPMRIFSFTLSKDNNFFYLVFPVTLIMVIIAHNITTSRTGRAFVSIRDSSIASKCMGINQARFKTIAFAISAFYAGLGGGLYAAMLLFVSPENFGLMESILNLVMIVVGGLGTVAGSIFGAILMTILPEILREFRLLQEIVYGLLLVVFVIFMPQGINGFARAGYERLSLKFQKHKSEKEFT